MKSIVIIPTYNEKENIKELIQDILRLNSDMGVVVVDDNSPDGTAEVVAELMKSHDRVDLIQRKGKLGLGSAYIEGFNYALKTDCDYIFQMDGDFSHDPKYIPDFLEKIKHFDVVIGSRYLKGVSVVNWPIRRLLLSYTANLYARAITGLKITDCTSGFKCFRREVLENIRLDEIKSDGYAFIIEMNYLCWKKGYKIAEIPIIFIDRHAGFSKMSRKVMLEAFFVVWALGIKNLKFYLKK